MSKGLFEPGIIAITALLLPFLSRTWRSRRYAICLAIAFVAALPWLAIWPFLLYQRAPELFMEWLWVNNLGHLTGSTPLLASHEPGYYSPSCPGLPGPPFPWRSGHCGATIGKTDLSRPLPCPLPHSWLFCLF